ncbi:MAG: hypothetical protein MUC46_09590 [Desulfobacterales bacterium]|nr:hypothetical protein [Desulfobacterales bacterium]
MVGRHDARPHVLHGIERRVPGAPERRRCVVGRFGRVGRPVYVAAVKKGCGEQDRDAETRQAGTAADA